MNTDSFLPSDTIRQQDVGELKLIDALPQMVWTARPDGSVDYFNEQFADFAGTAPIEDGLWVSFVHPADRDDARRQWARAVETGEPSEAIFRARNAAGEYRWILARARPLRNADNIIIKWVGTNTDINDRVVAEDALRNANRRKDEFLAMLAHELRNPLVPIGASAEMLSMDPRVDGRVLRASEMIARQVKHVTALVNDLLDVSRVTHGRVALEWRTVDMKEVVHDAVEQVRPTFAKKRHQLNIVFGADPACVCGDYIRLVQVVGNLLNNAAKYTPENGLVSVEVGSTEDNVVVRVMDNGVGMEPELLRRAFDLFEQGQQTAARSEGGLGIGLALVKNLVHQHRGTVTASSEGLGRGSEFVVRLPAVAARSVAKQDVNDETSRQPAFKRQRILLVDDNVDVAESLGAVLHILGHDVAIEHEGAGAIERARKESFDTCILDIGLPGMDGYSLARELHVLPGTKSAVFVAHTGYGQKEDQKLSAEAGFTHHLVKPAPIHELEKLLAEHKAH
ncbi:ATP-binding protein [Caballeronia sp. LP006]|uniref:hybrid sensor histidine kinase/response regulator n=1 Tax=Caballeronia sp. LP006 TaxID=3038552 RepID=UPI00285BE5CA|nr:ATP-binding protein [Caballeronia sp. LP006]MDR5832266.1 ATP-binding protein [Caballeronia sp. LP006]